MTSVRPAGQPQQQLPDARQRRQQTAVAATPPQFLLNGVNPRLRQDGGPRPTVIRALEAFHHDTRAPRACKRAPESAGGQRYITTSWRFQEGPQSRQWSQTKWRLTQAPPSFLISGVNPRLRQDGGPRPSTSRRVYVSYLPIVLLLTYFVPCCVYCITCSVEDVYCRRFLRLPAPWRGISPRRPSTESFQKSPRRVIGGTSRYPEVVKRPKNRRPMQKKEN